MTITIEQVEALNAKAQKLNAERQRLIGVRDSARQAYDKAVFAYGQKYGVALDDSNLQQEYNTVSAKLQADFEALQTQVQFIESGDYKNLSPQPPTLQTPAAPPVATQTAPLTSAAPAGTTPAAPAGSAPAIATQLFGTAPLTAPVQVPQAAPTDTAPAAPAEDISEQPFTPSGWGSPDALNKNFEDILGRSGVKFGE